MPKPKRYVAHVHLFDRREVLKLGAGALAAGTILPGCDALVLPELDLLDRLPDVVPNEDFYVQSAFGTPQIDPAAHALTILDRGSEVGRIDRDYVESLDHRLREHTLQCIGANPRFLFIGNAVWGGLPFREILDDLGIVEPPEAQWMRIVGADDYDTGLPISDIDGSAGRDPMWLVWLMNDEPLPLIHGAPFRFLVPGRYGTKNPKWPRELDFVVDEYIGHWESRGWSQLAEYRVNGLVLSPPTMAVVGDGVVRVLGSAFAGHTQIADVEITTDDGATWESATIDYSGAERQVPADATDLNEGPHIWTTWSFDWQLDGPGQYKIQVRVTDEDGNVTELDPAGTDRLNGYNAGMEIEVKVS